MQGHLIRIPLRRRKARRLQAPDRGPGGGGLRRSGLLLLALLVELLCGGGRLEAAAVSSRHTGEQEQGDELHGCALQPG